MYIMKPKNLKYAYFPGCSSKYAAAEYDVSTREICKVLGIKLIDIKEFSCCGAGVMKEVNHELNTQINARNFALAEKRGLDIMTICSTCILNFKKDLHNLSKDRKLVLETNEYLKQFNLTFHNKLKVKHFLWALIEDFGLEEIKKFKKVSFQKLKIAGFYGCHILRPSRFFKEHGSLENPDYIEKIIKLFGGKPIDLETKKDCCGFHIGLVNQKAANKISSSFVEEAINNKIDIIITVCPFCHIQMDVHQKEILKLTKKRGKKIPILHLSQFIGLGIGLTPEVLKLQKHVTPWPDKLLK